MFVASLKQASILKKLVDAIKDLANEANWEVDANGIRMQAMDSSHVCLIAFDLEAGKFDRYEVSDRHTFGINLGNLAKILKCTANDDVVTMTFDGGDALAFAFESGENRTSEFSLKLMQIECEQLGIPEGTEYDVVAELPSADLARIVRDLGTIGDNLTVSGKGGPPETILKFSTSGDIGDASMTLKGGGDLVVSVKTDTTLSFSSRYVVSFSKGSSLSACVKLSVSKDTPMCIEYNVGDVGTLKYYLAPKMNDDDDENKEPAAIDEEC